jgi:hypothetical protein
MSKHHRRRPRPFPAEDVQVAPAQADCGHAHKHVSRTGRLDLDIGDLEGRTDAMEEGGS